MNWISSAQSFVAAIALVEGLWVFRIDRRSAMNQKLAFLCFLASCYALASALATAAVETSQYWFWTNVASCFYLAVSPANLWALHELLGLRRRRHQLVLWITVVLTLCQFGQIFGNAWVLSGYHSTVWGNVFEISPDLSRRMLSQVTSFLAFVWGTGILVRALVQSRSVHLRKLLVQILVVGFMADIWGLAAVLLLITVDIPDLTCLIGIVVLVWYAVLIDRYTRLTDRRFNLWELLLANIRDAALFIDHQGLVVKASREASSLWTEEIVGRPALTVLSGWPDFPQLWKMVQESGQSAVDRPGGIRSSQYDLSLYPHRNLFDEFDGAVARLHPRGLIDQRALAYRFSPREQEVARLVCEGMDTAQIAAALFISPATVKNHLHNLYEKTQSTSRSELLTRLLAQK